MIVMHEENFSDLCLSNKGKPILISVSAGWCQPCRVQKPALYELEVEYKDKITFFQLDADGNERLCGDLRVSALPTTIIMKGNMPETRATLIGVQSKNKIKEKIEEILE